ncbi:MAG: S8 family serine peptidase [Verrucomicrobiales bacterium]
MRNEALGRNLIVRCSFAILTFIGFTSTTAMVWQKASHRHRLPIQVSESRIQSEPDPPAGNIPARAMIDRDIGMATSHVLAQLRQPREITGEEVALLANAGLTFQDQTYSKAGTFRLLLTEPSDKESIVTAISAAREILEDLDFVEPDYVIEAAEFPAGSAPLLRAGGLWSLHNPLQGLVDIDAPEAWDIRHDAPQVIIAVIDSGIDTTHPDLIPNLWQNPLDSMNGIDDDGNGLIDDFHGADLTDAATALTDTFGHGTHVAGIIGADAGVNGNTGDTVGLAWRCQLMGLKVLDAAGTGTVSRAVEAIDYAIAHGATLANLSWTTTGESEALRQALMRARNAGIICVTPAGNDADALDANPVFPAAFELDNIVTTSSIGKNGELSGTSNFSRRFATLAAPGESVRSTLPRSNAGNRSGTSVAAAHVTGVLALIQAQFPAEHWLQHLHRLSSGTVTDPELVDSNLLSGRLNAYRSLSALPENALPPFDHFATAYDAGVTRRFSVSFNNTFATAEPNEPTRGTAGGRSLWYRWTVPQDAGGEAVTAHVEAIADNESFDGGIWIYQGNTLSDLTLAASASAGQEATFSPAPGATYYLAVDSAASRSGLALLTVQQQLLNDHLADAVPLSGNRWDVVATSLEASADPGEPPHAGSTAAASLWWKWTAPEDGYFRISTAGSNYDTTLAIYDGPPVARQVFSSAKPHVVFTIDVSSTSRQAFRGGVVVGDVNGDGFSDTVLDAEIAGALALTSILAIEAPDASASIVHFYFKAQQVDFDPTAEGMQGAISIANGRVAIDTSLKQLRSIADGSNVKAALKESLAILNSQRPADFTGEVILLSDGRANIGGSYVEDADVLSNSGYLLRAFGPGLTSDLSTLRKANATSTIFHSPEELVALGWNVVAASDNSIAGVTSEAIFIAQAGKEYFISVDGYGDQRGDVVLTGGYGTSIQLRSQSDDQILRRFDNLHLSVDVKSDAKLYYQWYQDGNPLPGRTGFFYSKSSADLPDAGVYHVTMANGIQSLTSEPFTVSIESGPPEITFVQPRYTVAAGSRVDLTVGIKDYRFTPTYRWLFNGEEIPGAPNFNQLTILTVGPENVGTYQLEATTQFGTVLSDPMEVRISEPRLRWEKLQPTYPVDDLTGAGRMGNRYFLGGSRGRIFYTDNDELWHEAEVPAAPDSVRYWQISTFERIGTRSYAFLWFSSLPEPEEQGGLWSDDDGLTWNWDLSIPYISTIIPLDGRFIGVQPDYSGIHHLFETTDGASWSPISIPAEMREGTVPVKGDGLLLSLRGENVFTSTDGLTWDSHPFSLGIGVTSGMMFFDNGQFHIIPEQPARRYSSTNGIDWSETGTIAARLSLITGNFSYAGKHILFTQNGNHVSSDLLNWTDSLDNYAGGVAGEDGFLLWGRLPPVTGTDLGNVDSPRQLNSFAPIQELNGTLYANGSPSLYTSSDGEHWQYTETYDFNTPIAYGDGIYVRAANASQLPLEYSRDGVTWSFSTFAGETAARAESIAFGSGVFVAVFENGGILRSVNGIDWSVASEFSDQSSDLPYVGYHGGAFWTWSQRQTEPLTVRASADGQLWREIQLPGSGRMTEMASTQGRYVISGTDGKLWASSDGEVWEYIDLAGQIGNQNLRIAAGGGYFVAVCERYVISSQEGRNWNIDPRRFLEDVIFFNGSFYLVGQQGLVYRSLGLAAVTTVSFDQWNTLQFDAAQLANATISGRAADPDKDGRTNFLEFGIGSDPLVPDPNPVLEIIQDGSGTRALTYATAANHEVNVVLQESVDMMLWDTADITIQSSEPIGGQVFYRVTPNTSAESVRYYRLMVSE